MRSIWALGALFLAGAVFAESPDYSEGWAAYQRQDYTTAIRYLVMAADAGDARAARALADIHERGLGTPVDREQAFRWRRLAEELSVGKTAATRAEVEDPDVWRKRALEAEKREWEAREALRKQDEARKRAEQRQAYRSNEFYWGYGSGFYDPFWGPGYWGPRWGYGPGWGYGSGITFGFTQRYRW